MRRHVLGICFPQEQNTLLYSTPNFCRGFNREDFIAQVADLSTPEGRELLEYRLESDELAFCFGIQGVGSRLKVGEESLWTKYQMPFLGLHFDFPCHNPLNHVNESPFVGNLYYFESFLDARRRFFDAPQLTGVLPFDTFDAPPDGYAMDFAARPIKFLYLKSGGDLQKCIDDINNFHVRVRDAAWQQLERIERDPNLQICDLVEEIFCAAGLDRRVYERQFWGVVQGMDLYVRVKRSVDFVNWLKCQEGAVIIGDGWDAIDRTGARAEFRSATPVTQSYEFYRQTQFACNTNPYGRDVLHERVIDGLLCGCCVLTDDNAWWKQHFADVPALTRFDWGRPLEDQLRPVIGNSHAAAEASLTGKAPATRFFTGHKSFRMSASFAECLRVAGNSGPSAAATA